MPTSSRRSRLGSLPSLALVACSLCLASASAAPPDADEGWIPLFNGEDLSGWTASENPSTFRVEDGLIIAHGDRAHLFYTGDVNGGKFKDFELWVEVKTKPHSNSGIFFHTKWQDEGWPSQGHEVQVNQTQHDVRKTGGLYAVADVLNESPVKDNEWYVQHITVKGKHVLIRVNGEVTTDYTEAEIPDTPEDRPDRKLGRGTFALQGHDPDSEVHYRGVWVRPLD